MKRLHAFALSVLLTGFPAIAGVKDDVASATKTWAEAMSAHDIEKVVSLYDPEAVLWGTRSPTLRADPVKVREYFDILKTVPPSYKATLVDQHVRVFGDMAINTGRYTFSQEENGKEVLRPARFSFVYRKSGDRWLIVDHHSSAVPEAPK
jgi:uncharacterized protein (TIGR02246 family)